MQPLPEIRLLPTRPALDARPLEKRVGLIILATDHTSEPDFRRMVASERIGVYVARIPYKNPTTPENLRRMQPELEAAAALILPDEPLDAICYSCTSASVVIGDAEIEAAIRAARPGVAVVTPPMAGVDGLKALGARRISILTPYTVETSRPMAAYFAERGFEIVSFTCLGFEDDREMARIPPAALVELAGKATDAEADALFVSCTALRSALAVAGMEQAIGRPVVTSNQATAWNCLRLCGDDTARPQFGRLMTKSLSQS
ncbi:ectoine utilization protein EutA [Mesorhizobium sp. M4B.F.Ca.ET.215.01.1.1]|uniref:ectoine utilization protein EutA n=1 Tax=unclassified Mesorhizobium TaxID=325217 RepID=UPI000FCC7113|nr:MULTISPECIES: ectoine utilization protein EutA [unclassified Mesorhizobium]RUW26123.1 ectoine utilization protein EutA [Mesorhizobium sp. M4B.F.Ca.ET.013.02.1.1]RUW77521.1 ectoine utilization protein EutA [Mesorhizobium sp. M4B.F.Ca.ET.049.02.1.2]RVD41294.1 ectoine utilization protein EutA [Mesorhizobium sp. M4B.F.Ca.ET.019.03.1.1]RWX69215.1 ectoine utilization protein EutA [Mesorhizobium sp. M4B.F.Ca.ET.089.01.1.1]TGQ04160.1 ectoine utilization protein EutA [Mesorhizobium sp. M4B.F.Ca.ET.2